jgi:hypothetical protein
MEQLSDRISWIRELVKAEEQMEESGVIDLSVGIDSEKALLQESIQYLTELKNKFIEASVTFNELKTSALGRLKIYGIAKTPADFMLFRNGYKMIFSITAPGEISIRFNFLGPGGYIPSQIPTAQAPAATPIVEEHVLKALVGAFGDVKWTFNEQVIGVEYLVRYHMTLFIKESTK